MKGRLGAARLIAATAAALGAAGCDFSTMHPISAQPPGGAVAPPLPLLALPARPRALPLSGVEPCSLLAGSAVAQLRVGAGTPHGRTADGHAAACQWTINSGDAAGDVLARVLPDRTAALVLRDPLAEEVVQVRGYPAVRMTAPGADPERECVLYVDVADGQSLLVEFVRSRAVGAAAASTSAYDVAHRAAAYMIEHLSSPEA